MEEREREEKQKWGNQLGTSSVRGIGNGRKSWPLPKERGDKFRPKWSPYLSPKSACPFPLSLLLCKMQNPLTSPLCPLSQGLSASLQLNKFAISEHFCVQSKNEKDIKLVGRISEIQLNCFEFCEQRNDGSL